jgi:hypothetical protein
MAAGVGGAGGRPATIVIGGTILVDEENEPSAEQQEIDAIESVARAALQAEATLAVAASATSVKATVGVPSVDPMIDASAAAAGQLRDKID